MPDEIFRTLFVTADNAPLARQISSSFGSGSAGMWVTKLSSNGQEPATHFISSGYISREFAQLLTDPVALQEAANAKGVVCLLEDVKVLLGSSDIGTDAPFAALARMGLKIVQSPM